MKTWHCFVWLVTHDKWRGGLTMQTISNDPPPIGHTL